MLVEELAHATALKIHIYIAFFKTITEKSPRYFRKIYYTSL